MFRSIAKFVLAVAAVLPLASQAQGTPEIKLGYAKCAHCTPLSLTPQNAVNVKLEAIGFNTGNDVLTALLSKSIDVAQVTYLHYATALDKGFDVVAISGQVNGGSQILVGNDLPIKENDWASLKKVIADYKAAGKPFRVAASRGNAQDIHMRGAFAKQGIDVNKDVQFINIPNPSDHVQALRRGEVELICSVDPFATQIRQLGAAKFFAYPYDQAAGKLTNLIVTRSDVIASKPKAVEETVRSIIKVNDMMVADKGLFVDTIQKVTGLDKAIAAGAVENLYPDYKMYRGPAVAIGAMMRDLKYINSDVSAAIEKNMDYRFLEAATGKPKSALGY
ncbi:ABC transporter substrate-binding protein [Variovorax ginsengisoli]|uniref:ABC-type nitrate/sulfonate/bicarbonate transport system substrate-binding protein n=1 Tax=Variovorax ginsengisoli TaxID=363844 RepID=A0ABT9S3M7_9BURK|nr:ABC transporter substrate-binding protein [Variovorax ginsengisoli]MDP9897982.1 ABC-type nitrate/sulfonate/bicarbonate transport system substrate-binding protein [Variovorax ginsengisoli]